MRGLVIIAWIAVLTPGATVAVANNSAPQQTAKPDDRTDPNKVICRRESVTGSLAQTRKVCMTRAQWAERTRQAREYGEGLQQGGMVNSCGAQEPGRC